MKRSYFHKENDWYNYHIGDLKEHLLGACRGVLGGGVTCGSHFHFWEMLDGTQGHLGRNHTAV